MLLALDQKTTLAITFWLKLTEIFDSYLLLGIVGSRINESMDPGQVSRILESLALKAGLYLANLSGHSTRIGAAKDMLSGDASIWQIMTKV